METFGVSKDVIISCLGFRSEMANYLGSRPVDEYSEEFCSKVSNIYKAFGCSGIDIHANDFVCRTYRYKGAIQNNFMFPIYDGIRTSGKGKGVERVFNVMYPIWDTVRDSRDLSLLLKYREDNPIFDEILFVLIITGAWKFGDFIKMCNDFFILTDRFYPVYNSDEVVPEKRLNGYPCLPFDAYFSSVEDYIAKSFIGSICSETSISEVVKYETCAWDLRDFIKLSDFNEEDLLLDTEHKEYFIMNYRSPEISYKPKCDLLEASKSINDPWFKQFLQKLSIFDVVRRMKGIGNEDTYIKETCINPKVLLSHNICDRGMRKGIKASIIRDGVVTKVTVK